jgi:hypothetical protein
LGWNCSEKTLALPVQDHDTWQQQQRASADDEVKISMCGYCPITILTDPVVQVQDQVSIERNQDMQCIQIWSLQKPLFAGTEHLQF